MNELTISLDAGASKPLYEQIYEYIKKEIQSGGLPFEERLPSTRKLAGYLQVSRSTVELAYEQLLSEGYIESIPYKGYYVCKLDGLFALEKARSVSTPRKVKEKEVYQYDFSPSGIDLNSFPHSAWRKVSKNILNEENAEFFKLGEPAGEDELRKEIVSYLYQSRDVTCHPDQIIIGAGNDYLLMLLANLLGHENQVVMETPTYKKGYQVLSALFDKVSAIPMDENGIIVSEIPEDIHPSAEKSERIVPSVEISGRIFPIARVPSGTLAYVMPAHQYPMGTVMPIKRRMQLLDWASDGNGRYIIEDDYDSEFRYKGKPIPALKSYDRKERVIYLGTFSRSIAPSIRISYMILPKDIMEIYRQKGNFFSSTVSRVDQLIIARFLQEGYYERHLNKMRALYKGRHDVLINELQKLKDICSISGENAGVHLLLHFKNEMTEKEIIKRAKDAGVKVYGLSNYKIGNAEKEGPAIVILGYATMTEGKIVEAIEKLRVAWQR